VCLAFDANLLRKEIRANVCTSGADSTLVHAMPIIPVS
jgi:hypothetical protein